MNTKAANTIKVGDVIKVGALNVEAQRREYVELVVTEVVTLNGLTFISGEGFEFATEAGAHVEVIKSQEPANEIRSGYEVKAGWTVQTAKHGIVTVTEVDFGRAAGTNGVLIGGLNADGETVWERRSRFTSIIRYV